MEGLEQPTTADAIRIFGGRDWSMTESVGTLSPTSSSTLRRRNVKGKKTKSIGNIHALTKVRINLSRIFSNESKSNYRSLQRPYFISQIIVFTELNSLDLM